MRVSESVDIDRPPERVWALVADPTNDPRWCPKVQSVEAEPDGGWTVVHKPVPLRPSVVLAMRHVVREPPARLTLRQEDEASVFDVEYRLEPRGEGGTRFTQTSEFEWKRLPRMLHGTFRRGVKRDVRRQLRELKRLAEAG